ncbi:DNA-binding protein [Paraburkholderia aspalathi]|uniref:DNA-binding protein n=1 Tax=Paraburkholderia aspalathi TaxID=1324617 RepID=UPI0038BD054A
MIDTEQKLFRSAQDAMIFAFSYSMQTRDRSAVDRMAAPSPRTGKGLSGNDGAAQAGMIRRELEELTAIERAVLVARFAPRSSPCACGRACCCGHTPNPEYQEAIRTLEQAAMSILPSGTIVHYQLRRGLVEKATGIKIEIKALAIKCGVAERTAYAHWEVIKHWFLGTAKPKKSKEAKRKRVAAGDGVADVPNESELQPEVATAVDGIESKARKHADELLSGLDFVRP